jgi:voltage-gated potassium channel Kch
MVVHVLIAAGLLLAMEGNTDVNNVDVYNKHYTQLKPLFLPPRSPNGTKGTTNTTLKSFTQGMVVTTNFSNVVACMNPTQQALVKSYVSVPDEASMHWSLDSTIFFVATVFTTIGYGSFAPVTNFGKLYTSILAIIGVMHFGFVLGLATMQILNVLQYIASKVKKNKQTQEAVVLRITFAASTLYVFCLAFLALAPNLNWGYGNGLYFSVITFTTVGLGDYAPHFRGTGSVVGRMLLMLTLSLVLIIGLSLFASIIGAVGTVIARINGEADLQTPSLPPSPFDDGGGDDGDGDGECKNKDMENPMVSVRLSVSSLPTRSKGGARRLSALEIKANKEEAEQQTMSLELQTMVNTNASSVQQNKVQSKRASRASLTLHKNNKLLRNNVSGKKKGKKRNIVKASSEGSGEQKVKHHSEGEQKVNGVGAKQTGDKKDAGGLDKRDGVSERKDVEKSAAEGDRLATKKKSKSLHGVQSSNGEKVARRSRSLYMTKNQNQKPPVTTGSALGLGRTIQKQHDLELDTRTQPKQQHTSPQTNLDKRGIALVAVVGEAAAAMVASTPTPTPTPKSMPKKAAAKNSTPSSNARETQPQRTQETRKKRSPPPPPAGAQTRRPKKTQSSNNPPPAPSVFFKKN